ncbi:MAG TPA: hypothetical protein VNO70_11150 [Blastocatellia bacterium]|nr:hypothetical protein [Blastocatellia bacterium]
MAIDQIDVLLRVVSLLEQLNIPYVIGGSFASSLHGDPRSTNDIDLIAAIKPEHADILVPELQAEFYVSGQAIRRAIMMKSHFNVIHAETISKVDVFIAREGGFDEKEIERRQKRILRDNPEQTVYVTTPEDTILAKLSWFRRGNEVSDRQWRDVLDMIKVQAGKLDLDYLRRWAQELQVADLLERAFAQSKDFL